MRTGNVVTTLIFIFLSINPTLAQERNDPKAGSIGTIFTLDDNKYGSPHVLSLDSTIDVYESVKGSNTRYLIAPQLLFDQEEIKQKVDKLGEENIALEIDINIFFYTDALMNEISNYVIAKEKIEDAEIGIIPHSFLFVNALFDAGEEQLIYAFPPLSAAQSNFKVTQRSSVEKSQLVTIKFSSIHQAKRFADKPNLYLKVLVSIPETVSSEISFNEYAFLNSQRFRELEGSASEIKRSKITNISTSSGFSLDIKPLKIGGGGGNSTTKTNVQHQRFVSSEFINSAINNYVTDSRLNIKCRHMDTKACDEKVNEFKEELKSLVKNSSTRHTFNIVKNQQQNEYNLIHGATNETIEGAAITQGAVLKAKQELSNENKEDKSFEFMSLFKGSKNKENKTQNKHDIDWELKGGEWVPVSLNMNLISADDLSDTLNYTRSQEVIGRTRSNQYIMINGTEASNLVLPVEPVKSIEEIHTFAQLKKYAEDRFEQIQPLVNAAIDDRAGPTKVTAPGLKKHFYEYINYASGGRRVPDKQRCQNVTPKVGFQAITSQKHSWTDMEKGTREITTYNSKSFYMRDQMPKVTENCWAAYNRKKNTGHCDGAGEGCQYYKGVTVIDCYVNDDWYEWNQEKIEKLTDPVEIELRRSNRFLCSP